MKILVTGANGLLGRKLVGLLEQQPGITGMASARKAISFSSKSVETLVLDVTRKADVDRIVLEKKPDVIIHAAAMTQVDDCQNQQEECWKQNVDAVANVVYACEKHRVHLVHVSTDFVFDGTEGPLDEYAVPNPVNFYGKSKLEGERLVEASTCSWSIVRTVLVFGVTADMSRSNIVLWVKKSLEGGKPIKVVNDQIRTPTLAEDLAMGCYLAAIKKAKGIFHISGYEMMTPYDIAIATAKHFNLDSSLISAVDASSFTQPAMRPKKTGFIIDKAKRELGYEPRSFVEGLKVVEQQLS